MAAAKSGVSLIFHDVGGLSKTDYRQSKDFLTSITNFLDEAKKRNVTVGKLYEAMLQAGLQWKDESSGSVKDSDLFSNLINQL